MDTYDAFVERLRELISGEARLRAAAEHTTAYWTTGYTGSRFHVYADSDRPNEITARDLLAVSMLGVTIPAPVSIWLLEAGREPISELLSAVPHDADIWDNGEMLRPDGELSTLWDLLGNGSWPSFSRANDMARTKISKLLATKRPRLVPIYDSVIAGLLPRTPSYWTAFELALRDENLREQLSDASSTGAPQDAGLLRRIDALLWMIGKATNQPRERK